MTSPASVTSFSACANPGPAGWAVVRVTDPAVVPAGRCGMTEAGIVTELRAVGWPPAWLRRDAGRVSSTRVGVIAENALLDVTA